MISEFNLGDAFSKSLSIHQNSKGQIYLNAKETQLFLTGSSFFFIKKDQPAMIKSLRTVTCLAYNIKIRPLCPMLSELQRDM